MRTTVITALALAILGVVAATVLAATSGDDQAQPAATVGTTTTDTTTTDQTRTTERTDTMPAPAPAAPARGEDLSGPCDEAEHANDPRCTGAGNGAVRVEDDDRGGHGRDDRTDDRSDRRGGIEDGNSGHGSGGEDHSDDDNSGHGSGGGEDSSGHGGDDD